jgi:hypothetical protein
VLGDRRADGDGHLDLARTILAGGERGGRGRQRVAHVAVARGADRHQPTPIS